MLRGLRTLLALTFSLLTLVAAVAWQAGETKPDGPPARLPALRHPTAWYKGNLHTHSFWSDGDDFPEMIADWYKRHGYQFLALSDHNVLAEGERWMKIDEKKNRPLALTKYRERFGPAWVEERTVKGEREVRLKPLAEFRSLLEEPGRFLLVPAEEISHRFGKLPVHLNGVNLRDLIKPADGADVRETIRVNHRLIAEQAKKTKSAMLTTLNHPNFGWGVTAEDMALADELCLVEVYNGHPSVRNEGDKDHPDAERLWDIVLALRLGKHGLGVVYGLATDDAHGYHAWGVGKVNPGRGWVLVRVPYLSAEAIVRAMQAGDFYFSTGVFLEDVKRSEGELALTIRPEPGVRYRTEFIGTLKETPLESTPHADKDGKPVTRRYGPGVGQVLAESSDLSPRYKPTGKEWYVRARVTSTKAHPNPYRKGDVETAWTQPIVPAGTKRAGDD
jgi:hypothetical protein